LLAVLAENSDSQKKERVELADGVDIGANAADVANRKKERKKERKKRRKEGRKEERKEERKEGRKEERKKERKKEFAKREGRRKSELLAVLFVWKPALLARTWERKE